MRRLFLKLALSAVSLLLLLVVLEAGLRLAGWALLRMTPGDHGPPAGEMVILCVGDSFTMGSLATFNTSYPIQLEELLSRRLPQIETRVVNLGRAGSNTAQMLANLRRGIAEHRPEVVLVLGGWNNFRNFQGFRDPEEKGGVVPSVTDAVLDLRVYKLAQMLLERVRGETARPLQDDGGDLEALARVNRNRNLTSDSQGHFERGMALKESGDLEAAIECFVDSIEVNPKDPRGYRQIAKVLRQGRLAEDYFAAAINDNPDRVWPLLGMSILCQDRGRLDEAGGWLERAMGLEPELDGYLRQVRRLLEGDRARAKIERWIALDLAEMQGLCAGSGARMVIQTYPLGDIEVLARVATEHRLGLVDHKPAFDRIPSSERDGYFLPEDFHPNARGNAIMAENIFRVLRDSGVFVTASEGDES